MISFYAKWGIESDYDFVQFQVSTDGGSTWIGQCGNYTVPGTSGNGSVQPNGQPVYEGTQTSWVLEEINLSDYLGQQIKVRFQLRSDGGTTADGFYFDDFKVFYSIPSNNPPTSSFTSPSSVCSGSIVNFTDFSSNTPTSWSWDFGDGSSSNQQNPSHAYTSAGTYTVSLTVSNSSGTNTSSQNIVVESNPVVTLTSNDSDNTVCANQGLVQLTANPVNSILSGNGVDNYTFDPSIATIGLNTITASYTDANGCQGSAQISIVVEQCANTLENNPDLVQIFPNPSEGELSIRGLNGPSKVEVKDFNGKLIFSKEAFIEQDKIILSDYANGAYLIEIHTENLGVVSKKFFLIK
jgi:PKD repeat protein